MSDLTVFRDHCRRMAEAEHRPECPSLAPRPPEWVLADDLGHMRWVPRPPNPTCDGCVSATDRALFAQLAGEVDTYLAPQPDLFGDLTPEPEPATPPPNEHADAARRALAKEDT